MKSILRTTIFIVAFINLSAGYQPEAQAANGRCDPAPYLPLPDNTWCQGGLARRDPKPCSADFPQGGQGRKCFEGEGAFSRNEFSGADILGKGIATWKCSEPESGGGQPVCVLSKVKMHSEDSEKLKKAEDAVLECQNSDDKAAACLEKARKGKKGENQQKIPGVFRRK